MRHASTLFSATANDYFFVQGTGGTGLTGTMTITGLLDRPYRVQLCSSSSGTAGDRVADFRVNGNFSTLTPSGDNFDTYVDGYMNGKVMTWLSVTPVNGVLTITVQTAAGDPPGSATDYFGMLNGVRLVLLPPAGTSVLVQ